MKSADRIEGLRRARLKDRLKLCTVPERTIFVRMYGPQEATNDDFMLNIEQIAKHNMNEVVDKMPLDRLDWALKQVARTLEGRDE